ncbi:MAG: M23 family metallopeptidase [Psychromonas sp.]|nr:M23 family metallopeptidase [Psychromonas sp.]
MDNFDYYVTNKTSQFKRLYLIFNNRHIEQQLFISGWPVQRKNTRLTSPFGIRKSPFTGMPRMHKGVDLAGPIGTDIHATSAGVVVWAGKRGGFGNMVEITDGGGNMTRYGHARTIDVSVGDVVSKGQIIAQMGSTGRSTGPHVHYEVLKNGIQVNPDVYLNRKAI